MSNYVKGFVVAIEKDIHPDDAKAVADTIRMIKGVLSVDVVEVNSMDDYLNRSRIINELGRKLLAIIYPDSYSKKN